MKHIYVIGNGFDIDLGWRTSYKDFYDSKLKGWRVHFLSGEDCLPAYLLDHAGENWYDMERTIYDYCITKSRGVLVDDLMDKDYNDYLAIKSQLERFVKERSDVPVNDKSKAYEILKSYVERSSHTDLPPDMRPELISFNYTPLSRVAKQINPKSILNTHQFMVLSRIIVVFLASIMIIRLRDAIGICRNRWMITIIQAGLRLY